jgi:hypothetical protein
LRDFGVPRFFQKWSVFKAVGLRSPIHSIKSNNDLLWLRRWGWRISMWEKPMGSGSGMKKAQGHIFGKPDDNSKGDEPENKKFVKMRKTGSAEARRRVARR